MTDEVHDIDQAWEHNRRSVEQWIRGVRAIVDEANDGHRTRSEISYALEMGISIQLSSSPEMVKTIPSMLAVLVTMYLYGDDPEVSEDELPPLVTTDEGDPGRTMAPAPVHLADPMVEVRRRFLVRLARLGQEQAMAYRKIETAWAECGLPLSPFEIDD